MRLIIGCMDTSDSESRRIFFAFFEIYSRPYRAKKKVQALLLLLPKKIYIWREANIKGPIQKFEGARRFWG